MIVAVTDGQENASSAFTVARIREMIERKRAEGWTFVFLSADLDGYSEAGNLGYDVRSVQGWAPDGTGSRTAFTSVSRAAAAKRSMLRDNVDHDAGDFFQGLKEAEQAGSGPKER